MPTLFDRIEVRLYLVAMLVLGFAGGSAYASDAPCKKAIQEFLASPNNTAKIALDRGAADACWAEVEKLESSFNRLNVEVASGNDSAAEYLVDHLSLTDGGHLEDALISLGQYSDKKMLRFMSFAGNKRISDLQFSSAISALPLSLTDDFLAQLSAVLERRCAVIRISDKNLTRHRTLALEALEKRAAEIRRAEALTRKSAQK